MRSPMRTPRYFPTSDIAKFYGTSVHILPLIGAAACCSMHRVRSFSLKEKRHKKTTCGQCLHDFACKLNSSSFSPYSCSFVQLLTEAVSPLPMAGDQLLPLRRLPQQQLGHQRRRTRASRALPPATLPLPAFVRNVSSNVSSSGGCSVLSSKRSISGSSSHLTRKSRTRRQAVQGQSRAKGAGSWCEMLPSK